MAQLSEAVREGFATRKAALDELVAAAGGTGGGAYLAVTAGVRRAGEGRCEASILIYAAEGSYPASGKLGAGVVFTSHASASNAEQRQQNRSESMRAFGDRAHRLALYRVGAAESSAMLSDLAFETANGDTCVEITILLTREDKQTEEELHLLLPIAEGEEAPESVCTLGLFGEGAGTGRRAGDEKPDEGLLPAHSCRLITLDCPGCYLQKNCNTTQPIYSSCIGCYITCTGC